VENSDLQENKLLEVCFVDVGQGDGCLLVTPDDKFILIDAGQDTNMLRFLNWRFNLKNRAEPLPIEMLIITHSDQDHYGGFDKIVNHAKIKINKIYHNGIVERTGADLLGPEIKIGTIKYLDDIIQNITELKTLFDVAANRGRKHYPKLMHDAYDKKGIATISMLEKESEIDNFKKTDTIHFEVLAPVPETINGKKHLRVLGNDGETKNGHSVVIRLHYGKLKLLLSGDLNEKSQFYLAEHYTGFNPKTMADGDIETMIAEGRKVFQSDVAKSCHHGSDHFMDDFFSFINPIATVISSGDSETHTHPRPETLGAIGKHSRGKRPLIFSTELARSTDERRVVSVTDYELLRTLKEQLKQAGLPEDEKIIIKEKIRILEAKMERNVAVYGMINLRTDGEKVMMAQKKEEKDAGYIYWLLEPNAQGELEYEV
jgi:beta-lactamase superfamily II metal-dependent hydrolase